MAVDVLESEMIYARNDICDLCNGRGSKHYLSIPTGLLEMPTLPVRLCPTCKELLQKDAGPLIPLFDTVVRALRLLRLACMVQPLPSPDADHAASTGASVDDGPET